MSPTPPTPNQTETASATDCPVRRRHFLALGVSVSTTLIAGCTTETDLNDPDGGSTSSSDAGEAMSTSGTFRLLISDQPVAIGDFHELNVSFDRARIFRGDRAEDDRAEATDTPATTTTHTGSETPTETETEGIDDDPDEGNQRGFSVIDLDGATVDLTQVIGEQAIGVFEGDLSEGRYAKIELYTASIEGIVDGEPVDVMIPSEKLQIVKPFEITPGETLSFVFDINVVKKGRTGEYNLLPVISESGVAGQDVEVVEIGDARSNPDGTAGNETDGTGPGTEETEEAENDEGRGNGDGQNGGPPDDTGRDS